MVNSIVRKSMMAETTISTSKLLKLLSGVCCLIASLAVIQDFMESKRSGYAFHFSESLLFKTIWFLFIPILAVLYKIVQQETLDSFLKTTLFIISPIVIHFILLPFVALLFSVLFFEGRYGLYKMFSYTLAQDFYKLIVVYTGFILIHRHSSNMPKYTAAFQAEQKLEKIIISNGRDNTAILVGDIMQITSATPYVLIHLASKKHLYSGTLKYIGEQLDNTVFVRVHKTTLVNIAKVDSFKSRLNGDYDLQLMNGDTVRLSRTYASDFKKRFKAGHQDTT